jgi:hypothetical protein
MCTHFVRIFTSLQLQYTVYKEKNFLNQNTPKYGTSRHSVYLFVYYKNLKSYWCETFFSSQLTYNLYVILYFFCCLRLNK